MLAEKEMPVRATIEHGFMYESLKKKVGETVTPNADRCVNTRHRRNVNQWDPLGLSGHMSQCSRHGGF